MRYLNGRDVLPAELLAELRKYVKGACIYIPADPAENPHRRDARMDARDRDIRQKYAAGQPVRALAEEYFLSPQAIYKIIARKN